MAAARRIYQPRAIRSPGQEAAPEGLLDADRRKEHRCFAVAELIEEKPGGLMIRGEDELNVPGLKNAGQGSASFCSDSDALPSALGDGRESASSLDSLNDYHQIDIPFPGAKEGRDLGEHASRLVNARFCRLLQLEQAGMLSCRRYAESRINSPWY